MTAKALLANVEKTLPKGLLATHLCPVIPLSTHSLIQGMLPPSERVQILTAFVPKGLSCVYGHSPELHFIRDSALKALISDQMLQLKSIEDISVAYPRRCLTALSYGTYIFLSQVGTG